MSLLLIAPDRNMEPWIKALRKVDTHIDIETWPEVENKKRVNFIVAWNQPKGLLDTYPNLKAISSLGAGVDHLFQDDSLPDDVPICRVVSPSLQQQMKEYILNAVLNYQRNTLLYRSQQRKGIWQTHPNKKPDEIKIGIMGLGKLGQPIAEELSQWGYQVSGWSRTEKSIEEVETYSGKSGLGSFLENTALLICLLPLTPQTDGILDLELFKKLEHPAYLINVARGEHLVEEDLIYALDKEWMEGAALDVFSEEPLPEKHPFWNREKIFITPHVSSITPPEEVAPQIIENYKRALSGMELIYSVDREKRY